MKKILNIAIILALVIGLSVTFLGVTGSTPVEASIVKSSMTFYPGSAYDSATLVKSDASYTTAHDAASATYASTASSGESVYQRYSGGTYTIARGSLRFDTSALPEDILIYSVQLKLWTTEDTYGSGYLKVVDGSDVEDPAVVADYGDLEDETTTWGQIYSGSWVANAWNTITFTTTGNAGIETDDDTVLGLRLNQDIVETAPTDYDRFYYVSWDTTYKPQLIVTYYTVPTVTTSAATSIGTDQATLNGSITVSGGYYADYRGFVYDTSSHSSNPGNTAPSGTSYADYYTVPGSFNTGSFGYGIGDLDTPETYYFRACAHNSIGWSYGSELSFTTNVSSPTAVTDSETGVLMNQATIHGHITDDGGLTVTAWFEYGLTEDCTSTSTTTTGVSENVDVYLDLTDLTADTLYYYKFVAQNTEGTDEGDVENFTTDAPDAPVVTTLEAVSIGSTTVTLRGFIASDGGDSCEVRFQYGEDTDYGTDTTWVDGYYSNNYYSLAITGLDPATEYHFRFQAKNDTDTTSGNDVDFETVFDAPSNFLAKTSSYDTIDLTWTPQGDYTDVYYKLGGYPEDRNDGTRIYFGTGTSYSHSDLSPGTTYFYRAWSWKSGDVWSDDYVEDATTTTSEYAPTEPGGVDESNLPDPEAPTNWWSAPTGVNLADWPFFAIVEDAADGMGIPSGTIWLLISAIIVMVFTIVAWSLTGSLMWTLISSGVAITVTSAVGICPLWILLIYIVMGGSMAYILRPSGAGG